MNYNDCAPKVVAHANLKHFFQENLTQAIENQGVSTRSATIVYLVNLLTFFSKSENFFQATDQGPELKPLAIRYYDAVNATTDYDRYCEMQRLGDFALFVAGIFSHSLTRKPVDVDYYISMGGSAYAYLAESHGARLQSTELPDIFTELSSNFILFVDVLTETCEGIQPSSDENLLRLYEYWQNTGSKRAEKQLQQHGINPSEELRDPTQH